MLKNDQRAHRIKLALLSVLFVITAMIVTMAIIDSQDQSNPLDNIQKWVPK